MGLFSKIFKKSAPANDLVIPDADESIRGMQNRYKEHKTHIWIEISQHLEPRYGEVRAKRIAGLASNLATGEPHPQDLLDAMSDDDESIATGEATWAKTNPQLGPVIGDACWWLAQVEVLMAWHESNGQPISEEVLNYSVHLLMNAIEIVGQDPRYLRTVSWAFTTAQYLQQAYEGAGFAIAAEPEHPEGWRLKGNACFMLGKFEEAEYCFTTALKFAPGNAVLLGSLRELKEASR